MGKCCIVGCRDLVINESAGYCRVGNQTIQAGDALTLDGTTGQIILGQAPLVEADLGGDFAELMKWADSFRRLGVRCNADTPEDAEIALRFGAEGIGLCRTEHMFFQKERLPIVRRMILTAAEATKVEEEVKTLERGEAGENGAEQLAEARARLAASEAVREYHSALDRLLEFQVRDFKGILRVMAGKPVIIRLLDPPLHEFLPPFEELLVEVTQLRSSNGSADALEEKAALLHAVESMRESNPMLGLRGCRLGLMYGAINQMQVRAIFTAACDLAKEGIDVRPEIMVPLVGHVNEIRLVRQELEPIAKEIQEENAVQVNYKFGTMIEVPRAALTADEIAQEAEFFSFGTNDLTQTTFAYSRDDAEAKFLREYVSRGILPENPFQVLDRKGVGRLIEMATALGRTARPNLEVGICGEHGGDPSSIEFCHNSGLNYVSASPFRVPIARLAAAQAALKARHSSDGTGTSHG
jgi:pyruvate,orthophosphate dikinase